MDARSPLRADAATVLTPFARSDGSFLPPRRPLTLLAPEASPGRGHSP